MGRTVSIQKNEVEVIIIVNFILFGLKMQDSNFS